VGTGGGKKLCCWGLGVEGGRLVQKTSCQRKLTDSLVGGKGIGFNGGSLEGGEPPGSARRGVRSLVNSKNERVNKRKWRARTITHGKTPLKAAKRRVPLEKVVELSGWGRNRVNGWWGGGELRIN